MKELEFIEIIKKTLSNNSYIGDDCAYINDIGIVVTHDSLVEDIHFSSKFSTPYNLGYKSVIVNLSDIFASGAVPKFITISLSLPTDIDSNFVREFYGAVEDLSKKFDFEVVGGDITGGEKVFISVCAIGLTKNRKISSRKNAKVGDYVIVTGMHGSSAAGLWLLQNKEKKSWSNEQIKLIDSHLKPTIQPIFSEEIATKVDRDYAMMDTSDGLVDALFKIAQSSDVVASIDIEKVPYDKNLQSVAEFANVNYKDWVLYGGEDYQLIACIDEVNLQKIDKKLYTVIGQIKEKSETCFVEVNDNGKTQKIASLDKTFNHFMD